MACQALTAYRAATGNASYQPYPNNPCNSSLQYTWLQLSNKQLKPEESTNWGLGVVWSPNDAMSVALDYYDIEITNIIATIPRALAFRYGDQGVPLYGVDRGQAIVAPNGTVLPGPAQLIRLPIDNGAKQTSRGLDFEASYRYDTASIGSFNTKLSWSHTLEFNFTPVGAGTQERAGTFRYPKDRGQLGLGWNQGDWSANVIGNYIGKHSSGTKATSFSAQTTVDVQASVATPWNGRVTLGVRNIANKMPQFSTAIGFPNYINTLYNIWGRTPYLRYEQNF